MFIFIDTYHFNYLYLLHHTDNVHTPGEGFVCDVVHPNQTTFHVPATVNRYTLANGALKSLTLCSQARILPGVGHIQFPLISYFTNFSTAYLVASLDISLEYYVTSGG
jgi:hypothetical protein